MADELKYSLTNVHTAIAGILMFIMLLLISACTTTNPPVQEKDIFDRIVTPKIIFPDPAVLALFEVYPPKTGTLEGKEIEFTEYKFSLIPLPEWENYENDYYITITVIWLPGGTFPHQGGIPGMGPKHGFFGWVERTPDGKYDLLIVLEDRIPKDFVAPKLEHPAAIAKRLMLRYSQQDQ